MFGSLAQSGSSHHAQPPSGRCRPTSAARSPAMRTSVTVMAVSALASARRTPIEAISRLATLSLPSSGRGAKFRSSSASDPTSADRTCTFSEPCFVSANGGRYTASSAPSSVTTPPVAIVSGVTSTSTGSSWMRLSERPPLPVAGNENFARPSARTGAGPLPPTDRPGSTPPGGARDTLPARPLAPDPQEARQRRAQQQRLRRDELVEPFADHRVAADGARLEAPRRQVVRPRDLDARGAVVLRRDLRAPERRVAELLPR